jgi:hypothetical protein
MEVLNMPKTHETKQDLRRSRGQQKRRKEEAIKEKRHFSLGVPRFPRTKSSSQH